MSKFIEIQPFGTRLTGSAFRLNLKDPVNSSLTTITCEAGDSLFTTDLKKGDTIYLYKYFDNSYITATIDSITSATQLLATIPFYLNKNAKINVFDFIVKASTYEKKKLLVDTIVGYKRDKLIQDLVLLDISNENELDLVSPCSEVSWEGTSGNQRELQVVGHPFSTTDKKYKVQIDADAIAHAITVTTVADTNGSLHRTGFIFEVPGCRAIVMLHLVIADERPLEGLYTNSIAFEVSRRQDFDCVVNVDITKDDSAANIATAVYNALDAIDVEYKFTVSNLSSNTFRITADIAGKLPNDPRTFGSDVSERSTISFYDYGDYGAIKDTANGFDVTGSDAFQAGDVIEIKGALNNQNNGFKVIKEVISSGELLIKRGGSLGTIVDELATERDPGLAKGGSSELNYGISISSGDCGFTFAAQTTGKNSTFKWTNEADLVTDEWNATGIEILGEHYLENGVIVRFANNNAGYSNNDSWTFKVNKPSYVKHRGDIEQLNNIFDNVSEGTGISY